MRNLNNTYKSLIHKFNPSRNISSKLFLITFILMSLLLTITFTVQSTFIKQYYQTQKVELLTNNIDPLKDSIITYRYSSHYYNNLISTIVEFEEVNSAVVATYDLNTNTVVRFSTPSHNFDTDVNNSDSIIYESTLNDVFINVVDIWQNSSDYYWNVIAGGSPVNFTVSSPHSNIDYLAIISPLTNSDVLIVISPLQALHETVGIILDYSKIVFGIALILIVLLAFTYTKIISKPLVQLNNNAKKISKLDFSSHCDVTSKDELGELADTLNFLSSNLNKTLSELESANLQLQEDIERKQKLEKMRKEFTADVSHELKTPISIIQGYAEGLKDGIGIDDMDFYLDTIIDEANNMSTLVREMLDLSKLEIEENTLNLQHVNIHELTNNIYEKYNNSITDKNFSFHYLIDDSSLLVTCDRFRIEQALKNLLTNAVKHTPSSGLISLTIDNLDDEKIIIIVENSGSSIPKNEITLIWDKFYRTDKSRSKDSGGSGLGLAITKSIFELHNSLYGASNTSDGVQFYFTLDKYK